MKLLLPVRQALSGLHHVEQQRYLIGLQPYYRPVPQLWHIYKGGGVVDYAAALGKVPIKGANGRQLAPFCGRLVGNGSAVLVHI